MLIFYLINSSLIHGLIRLLRSPYTLNDSLELPLPGSL